MIIGIDGNEANVEKRVGISEYAFELLQQFSNAKLNPSTSVRLRSLRALRARTQNSKFIIYLKEPPIVDMPPSSQNWQYRIVGPRKFWTQIALPLDLYFHKPRPTVFFSPSHYAPRFSPVPTAISIMDMSFVYYPEMFRKSDLYQLRSWTAYSAKKARRIFTISKASKDDIIGVYRVPKERVVVTYPGIKQVSIINYQLSIMEKIRKKYGINGKYILFVGTLQPRKNVVRLIEAFSKVIKENPSLQLVIVGEKGWLYDEIFQAPKKFGVEDSTLFLDFVKDEDLPELYKHALCFVLPSLYEGFGLPVLEAMKFGCPVITSKVSSLPEAGGEACLYVDPLDTDDITSKILSVVKDETLRSDLIQKGYDQAKKFSWEKTAKETLKVLEELAHER